MTRGVRKDRLRIKEDILSLLPNHNDLEVMNILNMGTETYYRYKKMILTDAKELWHQTVSEELEYRALKLKDYLQLLPGLMKK